MTTTSEREIITTRIFKVPRDLVFKAWSDPRHLANWWGPAGFTNSFEIFDFREGGTWKFIMHGPEKGNYQNEVIFKTIKPPALIVWDRVSQPLFRVETTFEAINETETRLCFKMIFETKEACDKIRNFVPDKNEENMDKLEAELANML